MKPNKTSRRDFLKSSAAAVAVGPSIQVGAARKDKPNLLFLWTDEQRPDTLAVYGNRRIHAPNLNKLASESTVFKRAYCTQPVCTPSRSSIMTGLWPHETECVQNNIPLKEETLCFPELLGDSDYRTAYLGKWHLGDEIFAQHGFEEWAGIEDGYIRHYREARDREARSAYHHFLIELGYKPDTESNTFGRSYCARLPLDHCKPSFLEKQACDFLDRHKADPFVLHVNYLEPHMPFYGPLDNEHDPAEVDLPANFEDDLEDNEPLRYRLMRAYFHEKGFDNLELKTESDWRRMIANYWGLVTQVDLSVGGILERLEDLGLAESTIVVYTSDHGDMMGSHRLLTKTVSYEESVGIPWLIRDPRGGARQRLVENPVSQIDMVPTLLDLMNGPKDYKLSGKSLVPVMKGEEERAEPIFIQWNPGSLGVEVEPAMGYSAEEIAQAQGSSNRMVVTPDGWKLVRSDKDNDQLFNLTEDPHETTNLIDSEKHKEVVTELSKQIEEWQEKVGDTVEVL
jgi:arylsulfatase A-like enzyme